MPISVEGGAWGPENGSGGQGAGHEAAFVELTIFSQLVQERAGEHSGPGDTIDRQAAVTGYDETAAAAVSEPVEVTVGLNTATTAVTGESLENVPEHLQWVVICVSFFREQGFQHKNLYQALYELLISPYARLPYDEQTVAAGLQIAERHVLPEFVQLLKEVLRALGYTQL